MMKLYIDPQTDKPPALLPIAKLRKQLLSPNGTRLAGADMCQPLCLNPKRTRGARWALNAFSKRHHP